MNMLGEVAQLVRAALVYERDIGSNPILPTKNIITNLNF